MVAPVDDLALLPGTGGTTGKPKGVMLSGRNIETMTALTLIGYPFKGRPTYLALAPLTHAAGVLCFPIMTLGGRVVIMHHPDIGEFLDLIARYRADTTRACAGCRATTTAAPPGSASVFKPSSTAGAASDYNGVLRALHG
jgi:acyl-CoA synthetase (AMP-forming)/AMP-acid ligase II